MRRIGATVSALYSTSFSFARASSSTFLNICSNKSNPGFHPSYFCNQQRFVSGSGNQGSSDAGSSFSHSNITPRQTLPSSATELPETSFLKCIEKEILDEKLRLDKEENPPAMPSDWQFYHQMGTSIIYGRRLWVPPASESEKGKPRPAEKHFLRAQLTTRDASLDPECDVRGEHFPFSIFFQPCLDEDGKAVPFHSAPSTLEEQEKYFQDEELSFYENSIEARCDLIDGELHVSNILVHGEIDISNPQQRLPIPVVKVKTSGEAEVSVKNEKGDDTDVECKFAYCSLFDGYQGPSLDEAEESVLDGMHAWLTERRIDDIFAEFIGRYSVWVEQQEYERWLQHLKDYVSA